jgi:hypothetical protein
MLLTDQFNKLTAGHLPLLEKTRKYWTTVGLATFDCGSDKSAALEGLKLAYRAAGLNPPAVIVWLDSPRAGSIATRLLKSDVDWPASLVPEQKAVWEEVWKQSVRQVEQVIGSSRWGELRSTFKKEAEQRCLKKHGRFIEKDVKEDFAERMGIWLWRYLRKSAGASTLGAIRTDVEQNVRAQVESQVAPEVLDEIYRELVPPIRQQTWTAIGEPVRLMIAGNHGILAGRQPVECSYGHLDCDWIAYYQFLATQGIQGIEPLEGMKKLAESCGWWWPYENICFVTGRPRIVNRDNRGRLHSAERMAIRYPDGWGFYAWHGIIVPQHVIVLREPITVEMIHAEPNVEVRRVLIERFGLDKYLKQGSVRTIHRDQCGTLYSMNTRGDEPIFVVHVINSTPEPDGSYNEYFLRVPPTMKRAREAVAWTFGLTEEEYIPLAET